MLAYKFTVKHEIPKEYFEQYNLVCRSAYTKWRKGYEAHGKYPGLYEVDKAVRDTYGEMLTLLDASLIRMASQKTQNIKKKEHVCFGNKSFRALKRLGIEYAKEDKYNTENHIVLTEEALTERQKKRDELRAEYHQAKNHCIHLIGSKKDKDGNRKAKLSLENKQIIFRPEAGVEYAMTIQGDQERVNEALSIQRLCERKAIPFSLDITPESVSLIFDEAYLPKTEYQARRTGRTLAIDMNPNEIGLVVVNHQGKILYKKIMDMRDLHYPNRPTAEKHKHETVAIAMTIVSIAKRFQCASIAYEDLNIKSSDKGLGKGFNYACNNLWNRRQLVESLDKHCILNSIKSLRINPAYSSFVGCLMHEGEFDSVASAMEIARRANELLHKRSYEFFPKNVSLQSLVTRWMDIPKTALNNGLALYNFFKENKGTHSFRLRFDPDKPLRQGSFSSRLKSEKSRVRMITLAIGPASYCSQYSLII